MLIIDACLNSHLWADRQLLAAGALAADTRSAIVDLALTLKAVASNLHDRFGQLLSAVVDLPEASNVGFSVAIQYALLLDALILANATAGDRRVCVIVVYTTEDVVGAEAPIKQIIRNIQLVKQYLLQHENYHLIIWPLLIFEIIAVFQQWIQKLGVFCAVLLGWCLDLVFCDFFELVLDTFFLVDPFEIAVDAECEEVH